MAGPRVIVKSVLLMSPDSERCAGAAAHYGIARARTLVTSARPRPSDGTGGFPNRARSAPADRRARSAAPLTLGSAPPVRHARGRRDRPGRAAPGAWRSPAG